MNIQTELSLPQHYDLRRTFALSGLGRNDPTTRLSSLQAVHSFHTPDGAVTATACRSGDGLAVTLQGPGGEWLLSRLDAFYGLQDAPEDFQPEGKIGRLWRDMPGIHLPKFPRIFPRLMQTVLQQLVSWEDATYAWRSLVMKYGRPAPGDDSLRLAPDRATLKQLAYYDLVACGILPRQARLILKLAGHERKIERLAVESPEKLKTFLAGTPGIGPWTINYLFGSVLGDPDAVLLGDYALPHTVAWFFKAKERSDDREMLEILKPFVGHRFRVQHLLMQSGISAPRRGPKMPSQRSNGLR